jgi:hypothetical protein
MSNELERFFPRLANTDYEITSEESSEYNCIAWAAGDTKTPWWPDPMLLGYWPHDVPREESLSAFISLYESLGYAPCPDGKSESGMEKVALFVKANNEPTHAALQLPNGRWSSKIGDMEDIEHELDALNSAVYGSVAVFLTRRRSSV